MFARIIGILAIATLFFGVGSAKAETRVQKELQLSASTLQTMRTNEANFCRTKRCHDAYAVMIQAQKNRTAYFVACQVARDANNSMAKIYWPLFLHARKRVEDQWRVIVKNGFAEKHETKAGALQPKF